MRSIYSPRQIQAATFFGGPFAAAYFLKFSFESIDKHDLASKSFIFSLIGSVLIIGILPFLPEKMPNNVIPLLYLIPVVALLKKHYFTKEQIIESEEFEIESSWKVAGISLASVILYGVIAFGYLWVSQLDDDVANNVVNNINTAKIELNSDYFLDLKATKDLNGSGVLMYFTLNNGVVYQIKDSNPDELRAFAIQFIGLDYLKDLAKSNVYFIIHFQTKTEEVVNKVILSPSNIESN
ncbi:hypothetical protein [Thalassotalea ganghwensis]